MQLKRKAVIGLTTRPAVCCIIFKLYHSLLFYYFASKRHFGRFLMSHKFGLLYPFTHAFMFLKAFIHLSYGHDT